ncbi:MAG: RNA polymerase sigma factor [Planctomycetota bacterium]
MGQALRIYSDDNLLVEKCRKGDSRAMEILIIKYQDRIYNVILKICGNTDDAAELTQDTFVKVLQNIDKFQSRSSFYTWAFRIAVNLTINYCKRNIKLGLKSIDAEDNQNSEQTKKALKVLLKDDKSADPATIAENKELADLILTAVMQLDDAHRAVIVLRDIEGMNYAQIADILNINLGTVKSRLSRARSQLRERRRVGPKTAG